VPALVILITVETAAGSDATLFHKKLINGREAGNWQARRGRFKCNQDT
jgi:hypothetical protein